MSHQTSWLNATGDDSANAATNASSTPNQLTIHHSNHHRWSFQVPSATMSTKDSSIAIVNLSDNSLDWSTIRNNIVINYYKSTQQEYNKHQVTGGSADTPLSAASFFAAFPGCICKSISQKLAPQQPRLSQQCSTAGNTSHTTTTKTPTSLPTPSQINH